MKAPIAGLCRMGRDGGARMCVCVCGVRAGIDKASAAAVAAAAAQKRLSKQCPRQSRIAHTHGQTQGALSDAGISHPPGECKQLVMLHQAAAAAAAADSRLSLTP